MFDKQPRVVSKRFGLIPAFGLDAQGTLAVVQANAWIPKGLITTSTNAEGMLSLLQGYWWMLNSDVFVALLKEYCPNVAGGQLDLEHKYVKYAPLPVLRASIQESGLLQELVQAYSESAELPPRDIRNRFAALAYGTAVDDWLLPHV